MSICGRCVNTLNELPDVAENAEKRIGELLRRGMERRALQDLETGEPWQKQKAQRTLSNIDAAHAAALLAWLNRLLADSKNTKKDFKILRAHRRGLLHYDRPSGWGYPNNWPNVASRIRQLDGYQCVVCAAGDRTIDVHHIVYVSNFGTHQQTNLISLCRPCHESEHKRRFDFGENENEPPAEPPIAVAEVDLMPREAPTQALAPTVPPEVENIQPPRNIDSSLSVSELTQPTVQPALPSPLTPVIENGRIATDLKFCGSCRTLVSPKRVLLFFKQCSNCQNRM